MRRQESSRREARHDRRARARGVVFAGVVFLIGTCVILFPAAATWISSLNQLDTTTHHASVVEQLTPANREQLLAAATAYNEALRNGPVSDPFTSLDHANLVDDDPYWDLLRTDGTDAMSEIVIPKIDLRLPIFHGTSDSTLDRGVGHLRGTALPVGGVGTHTVLTGHNGLARAELFSRIDELQDGDDIVLDTYGEQLVYRVTDIATVLPTDVERLQADPSRDLLTLITCTPTGINSHRLLVTAERVFLPEGAEPLISSDVGVRWPWWAVGFAGAILAEATVLWILLRRRR